MGLAKQLQFAKGTEYDCEAAFPTHARSAACLLSLPCSRDNRRFTLRFASRACSRDNRRFTLHFASRAFLRPSHTGQHARESPCSRDNRRFTLRLASRALIRDNRDRRFTLRLASRAFPRTSQTGQHACLLNLPCSRDNRRFTLRLASRALMRACPSAGAPALRASPRSLPSMMYAFLPRYRPTRIPHATPPSQHE